MNIFQSILTKNKLSKISDYETTVFEFDNIKYDINEILKITNLLPKKDYQLTVLEPIFENIDINFKTDNIFDIAQFVGHVNNFNIDHLIILQIDDNHYKYVYGYEYIIKQLTSHKIMFAVKIITTNILHQIYIKNKKKLNQK